MNKPKLSVKITSISDPTITKTYTKANGLRNLSIDGVSNTLPYYGIISRAGSVELIDMPDKENQNGWLKTQSDNNILPDVSIEVILNEIILFSFNSENDITYTIQDKKVTIELSDTIDSLQQKRYDNNLIISNTDGLVAFMEICSFLDISVKMDDYTKNYLKSIYIKEMPVVADSHWNIIEQFVYGVRAIFFKIGNSYYIKKMKE